MTQTPVSDLLAASSTAKKPARPLSDDVVVRCAGLSKTFKDFWMRNRVRAVDNIDLDIRKGEVFGLLGPNGSGKSTTIKMILGLLNPTAGRISVFGKRPEDVSTKKLIGYLPEESYLYRFLNARETLEYYGKLFNQSHAQSQKRIDMLLEMVGLDTAQRRPVGEYSKGMQRRIGLAQALINDPQLLILDEPTTGLDPIGTKQIKDLIIQLAERGKTILLCSHLLSDVEDVCDRVSIMFGGKVHAHGTCDELLVQQDATTIQTTELDEETIREIQEVLARRGKAAGKVDHPRQRLEQLFLDIVHKAQSQGTATSGAKSGGRIASFLTDEEARGAHMPENVEARKLVEQLVTGVSPVPTPKVEQKTSAQLEAEAAARKASQQQQNVLDSLVKPKDAPEPPAKPKASAPDKPLPKPAISANADLGLINQLVGQKTAATPERAEAKKPPGVETPKAANPASTAPKAASGASASKDQTNDGEEGPDTSFLDAMNQVKPYDEPGDDKKK